MSSNRGIKREKGGLVMLGTSFFMHNKKIYNAYDVDELIAPCVVYVIEKEIVMPCDDEIYICTCV